jgi:hypothetical protein
MSKKPGVDYAPLPITFEGRGGQKGFHFTLLDRQGDLALFKKHKEGHVSPFYELVVVQYQNERVMAGITISARQSMPSSELWGSQGWTFLTEEDGRAAMAEKMAHIETAV